MSLTKQWRVGSHRRRQNREKCLTKPSHALKLAQAVTTLAPRHFIRETGAVAGARGWRVAHWPRVTSTDA